MKIGFYYGSFDPFTNGHLFLISQAAERFDKIIITIGSNPLKMYRRRRFTRNEMERVIQKVIERNKLENVEIRSGFFINIWRLRSVKPTFIRGIRNKKDYIYEKRLANIFKILGFKTIFIRGCNSISSTMIMNKLKKGQDVKDFLPKEVLEIIKANSKWEILK